MNLSHSFLVGPCRPFSVVAGRQTRQLDTDRRGGSGQQWMPSTTLKSARPWRIVGKGTTTQVPSCYEAGDRAASGGYHHAADMNDAYMLNRRTHRAQSTERCAQKKRPAAEEAEQDAAAERVAAAFRPLRTRDCSAAEVSNSCASGTHQGN